MTIPAFDLIIIRTDEDVVVKIVGELDLATARRLDDTLVGLASAGPLHVVVDLAELAFIDASGLRVLLSGTRRMRDLGGDLTLQSPTAHAMKVFAITGLTNALAINSELAAPR